MLGCRNIGVSLIGKLNNIIEYYDGITELYEKPKIPQQKVKYVINSIKDNNIISKAEQNRFLKFVNTNIDKELIENFKLIRSSLIENRYFERVSDHLYSLLFSGEDNKFDDICEYSTEYFALLMDYVGISVYQIKNVLRNSYRYFFEKHNQNIFLKMFTDFAEIYDKNNNYVLFVKMDREFDDKLINSLRFSQNYKYIIYSKSGFEKRLLEEKINNKKNLQKIIENFVDNSHDNNYFISITLESKDIWHAIKEFRQKTIQPFIGTMLYSGIRVLSILTSISMMYLNH